MARSILVPAVILAVAAAQSYQIAKPAGTECAAVGLKEVATAAQCQAALKSLAGSGAVLKSGNDASSPAGCNALANGLNPDLSQTTFNPGPGLNGGSDFFRLCVAEPPPTTCFMQKGKLAAGAVDGMTCAEKFDQLLGEKQGPPESTDPGAKPLYSKCELTYAKLVASAPACEAGQAARLFSAARGPVEAGASSFNAVVAGLAALVAFALATTVAGLSRRRRAPWPEELEVLAAEARTVA